MLRYSRIRVRLCDPRAERVCCPVLVGRLGPGLPLLALDNATIALRSPDLAWRRAEAFFWRHEDCFPDMGETTLRTEGSQEASPLTNEARLHTEEAVWRLPPGLSLQQAGCVSVWDSSLELGSGHISWGGDTARR